ncbi:hypothetical protein [Methylibium petroleiphilum]|uniref:AraC-type arabinose-binding/dimerisation domain-containing protein n=1 Tax=Methylibium petroleiphilum (strain ATCC BAA-1232 / LMG 22953 / PM1) TaxID=420662 RepID=A2SNA8_METPP|nr:hypothetical protein [Methylibium petroleiphilum]ABM97047.1 hypothetical protein Mpe_B0272 [Methylibium petroleiphilum PM1]
MSGLFCIRWDEWRGSLDGRPTMWIRRLARVRGWTIDLHKFVGPDDPGCFHTHPSRAFRLVLAGGYVEEVEGGQRRAWRVGRFGLVRPELSHRIEQLLNGRWSYSLWIRGPKTHRIELRGQGWDAQRGAAT